MADVIAMKILLESALHDSGSERERPLKYIFLAQRKWVIACAAFVFLVSNKLLAIKGDWLVFHFAIDEASVSMLRAVSLLGLTFFGYMVFNAYAFLKTHRIEQRRLFDELDIEERDTFKSRLEDLNEQASEIEDEIRSKSVQIDDMNADILEWVDRTDILEEYQKNVLDSGALPAPKEIQKYLAEVFKPFQRSNILAKANEYDAEEIQTALSRAEEMLAAAIDVQRTVIQSKDRLEIDYETLRRDLESVEKQRSEVIALNEVEWKKFYRGRTISDGIALVPTGFAALLCACFVIGSIDWSIISTAWSANSSTSEQPAPVDPDGQ